MELEKDLGFRSSFNFVPEGDYAVSCQQRDSLEQNGFEVGVHDLRHDGKLYRSRRRFLENAGRINRYLKEWGAKGFRSGFMLHNLGWLRDLDIAYDLSTFDTDPFEPQPDKVDTIFPFWVPGRNGDGYVEMPLTMPSDSTVFLLLGEKNTALWEKKLDWIAQRGGMVLINTHPDYMNFGKRPANSREYSVRLYESFLQLVKARYAGQFWHVPPCALAEFAHQQREILRFRMTVHNSVCCRDLAPERKIWIDLENTPHIPFFKPVIHELENRGAAVLLTARDAFQTCEMATQQNFSYLKIGRHYGRNRILKVWGLLVRSLQLLPFALREKPDLALSHGSRAQIFVCNLLGIPSVLIMDYEHTKTLPMVRPGWEIVPEVVSPEGLHCRQPKRIRKFSGIKEDVYVPDFKPDPAIVQQLGLNGDIVVTVRPPATEAHYHNPDAEVLFERFMNRICAAGNVKAVLLPRNQAQQHQITVEHPDWFKDSKVIIPSCVIDGLNLLWHSDLAVSGGGTMNREAAALGIPVYSIFRGKIGAVDRSLQAQGRLTLIQNRDDIENRIALKHRDRSTVPGPKQSRALLEIVHHIEDILKSI